ncbi:hypothetical protein GC105_02445 [Alkalibaculum sp. M08DMB]|uniref:SipW-cognate class signal peptide n=1 Tax=Alkalibaculum sporogenes TaxID=2655001 RepID=A0A6A7K670_9FIRM|nr:hypothetical protein [Alkalibaculum sporogenes]MPW24653.1 hypothetical protein [Alkalibaculum sporogenes]
MKNKFVLISITVALCAVIITGATFAYLTATSDEKVNTFTKGTNIEIELREPAWDGQEFGESTIPEQTSTMGITKANNMVPGRVIPKDPKVKNTSVEESVWIAIKLDYEVEEELSTYSDIDDFATIAFSTDWEAADQTNTVFYYKTQVASSVETASLFDNITILSEIGIDDLHSFNITIQAYAVQAEGVDYNTAKAELDTLILQ